jgi:hypothetical protein
VLGSKEAEMQVIGCDLHASQQSVAVLEQETGETFETTLKHAGDTVRDFYAALPRPAIVGIDATWSMGWFLTLMEDLDITCRVGHPARIRATEPRRQKHDRRDAVLLRDLLAADRFPAIWQPSTEFRDLRALLHRNEWVRMRTRVRNTLQSLALAHGIRRRAGLWSRDGQATLTALPLQLHASDRRSALMALHVELMQQIHA